jgi:hypothetical protein
MSSRLSDAKLPPFDANALRPKSRREADADKRREQAEQEGLQRNRRWRRTNGRTEVISLRTSPEIKDMIVRMADAEQRNLVEIIEDAIRTRYQAMKG